MDSGARMHEHCWRSCCRQTVSAFAVSGAAAGGGGGDAAEEKKEEKKEEEEESEDDVSFSQLFCLQ